jgi:hypothetical protein
MDAHGKKQLGTVVALAGLAALGAGPAHAEQVSFSVSGSISFVAPSAPGFPATLAGLEVGDPVSYLLTVEVPVEAEPNPFSSPYDTASYYTISSFSFQADVNGVALTLPVSTSDRLFVFVWDGDFAGLGDGFTLNNTSVGFLLNTGNLSLAPSTFDGEAFPTSTITGPIAFQASLDFASPLWFVAQGIDLTLIPEPSTWVIVTAGLMLAGWAARPRQTGAACRGLALALRRA